MAKIELKHCTIRFKDGFSGTAVIDGTTPPADSDTSLTIGEPSVNHPTGNSVIPIGARFTVENIDQVYTVTARTPDDTTGPTTAITFTPALATADGIPSDEDVITFAAQELSIKVGDGNLTYTLSKNFEYDLDRGVLDTVREGDEAPMDVNLDMVYEHITTGTSEKLTPMDVLRNAGDASEWVTSSTDACEPYAIDLEVEHTPPCAGGQKELTLFPDFRADSKEVDLDGATISLTGRCNATEPTYTREDQ